jgi:hypothetical protein
VKFGAVLRNNQLIDWKVLGFPVELQPEAFSQKRLKDELVLFDTELLQLIRRIQ